MSVVDARRVVDGVIPDGTPVELTEAVRKVARRTEQLRTRELARAALAEVTAGRVKEVHDSYVLLVLMNGPATLIPRWMAVAAGRERVGAFLALVTDKLDGSSAVVEAVPAIDVDEDAQTGGFSPFGRDNRRLTTVTADDERVLMGEPEPLRVLVPVTIAS
ncbi:hypothetical protein [Micromonospora wenchangensis]|uniref:hypothetical protein n=1 Tax=Micromonospora wenchangensis TaxID=1185415 RepID=UPI0037F5080D